MIILAIIAAIIMFALGFFIACKVLATHLAHSINTGSPYLVLKNGEVIYAFTNSFLKSGKNIEIN